MLYEYREDEHSGKLFLKVITLFECYPGTTEKKIRIDFRYTKQGDYSSLLYQGESYDGTYEEIRTDYPPISAEELEKLWVDYPKFGEYDQLIRLDRIPQLARERILEYTGQGVPPPSASTSSEASTATSSLRSSRFASQRLARERERTIFPLSLL